MVADCNCMEGDGAVEHRLAGAASAVAVLRVPEDEDPWLIERQPTAEDGVGLDVYGHLVSRPRHCVADAPVPTARDRVTLSIDFCAAAEDRRGDRGLADVRDGACLRHDRRRRRCVRGAGWERWCQLDTLHSCPARCPATYTVMYVRLAMVPAPCVTSARLAFQLDRAGGLSRSLVRSRSSGPRPCTLLTTSAPGSYRDPLGRRCRGPGFDRGPSGRDLCSPGLTMSWADASSGAIPVTLSLAVPATWRAGAWGLRRARVAEQRATRPRMATKDR